MDRRSYSKNLAWMDKERTVYTCIEMEPYSGYFLNRNEGLIPRVYAEKEMRSSCTNKNDKMRTHRRMDGWTELFPSEKGTESLLRVGVGKEEKRPFRAVRNQDVRIDPRWIWRTFVLFNNTRDIKLGFFMPTNGTADEKTRYVTIKDAWIGKRARFWFPSVIFMPISNITSREGMKEARISKNARFWSSNAIFKNKTCDGKARVGKETHFEFFLSNFHIDS